MLANGIHKGLLHVWRYRVNLIAQLAMFCFLFVGIGFLMGGGRMDADALPSMLVGFVVWYYAFMAVLSMSTSLAAEAQTGTLEQTYISPAPAAWIVVGRALATFVTTTVMGAVMVAALVLIFGMRLTVSAAAWPIFGMTLAGVFGFRFMVGGARLAFKRVDAVASLVQNMLLFMNGTLLPVDRFPAWMAAVSKHAAHDARDFGAARGRDRPPAAVGPVDRRHARRARAALQRVSPRRLAHVQVVSATRGDTAVTTKEGAPP